MLAAPFTFLLVGMVGILQRDHGTLYLWSLRAFPELDARKISSTNMLEQLNKEIRRRTNIVGIFPSPDSCLRLVTIYLI